MRRRSERRHPTAPSDALKHIVPSEFQALAIGCLQPVGGDLEEEDRQSVRAIDRRPQHSARNRE